ncbi:MAG TPA: amylo-alpha-1,6-glucosidase [Candidatus Cloacimonas sp.]|jgi:predicted glycogen debranching enzyme|nr:glycogen debranching enzyme N-terminal domain-containing protein [Candidatus Cloacimonas sp.]HOQ77204.1 amylo-alpha-1,6-glucosidase [Candidatus Cloacimonas sp.]HPK59316.1 amylo-alpha-1,6-glucosidase [Candidatus Cloacimonas sp.]HPZ01219.1 amylo-alpha-1,6-glucosidase [Candidatus Cloacimonas sp.]HQB49091.1 amylo-alpha-1,6-glucosidase [Candidatus Cloacimonas sp.]
MNNYFMETHHHEWILTNRRGGYALGTGNLINQRKYHSLLVSSDNKFNRTHLVAGIEEKIEWRGEIFNLDSNNYSNCIYPEGFLHLVKPWLRPYPIFLYSALPHQNDILILKEIMMDESTNTTLVKYTNLGHHLLHFELHPKFTMINHHQLNCPGSLDFLQFDTEIEEFNKFTRYRIHRQDNNVSLYGAVLQGEIIPNRNVYYNVFYPWEVMNGYEGIGDQITLVQISFDLKVGKSNYLLFSDTSIEDAEILIKRIEERYAHLPKPLDYPIFPDSDDALLNNLDYNDNFLYNYDEYLQILEFALKDFLANDDVVAGYPFYGAWGRDTMIVLNALLHTPNQQETVEKILNKYKGYIKDGLIPNMMVESGKEANYDSIDSTLWLIILLWKLGKLKQTVKYWKDTIAVSEEVLTNILHNDKHPFSVRSDGLIELHSDFAYGTWMDVRIEGKPITPRNGAPIEINSLWYNALCCYESMCSAYIQKSRKKYQPNDELIMIKNMVKTSLQKFYNEGYLADRIVGEELIMEIRPNAIIALSLPWQVFSQEVLQQVFERSFNELYTNYGIRTLSPNDIRFRKKYYGTQRERDLAYHNGSVWAWLLGPFCGLYERAYSGIKTKEEIIEALTSFISTFRNSFMKGHIASIAEVWDGDAPHFPKGAPAQAWSVAALYNVENYILFLEESK